jgi:FixJ family two-component response regulator
MLPYGSDVIAILDDEPGFRQALSRLLKAHGLAVQTFATASEFLVAAHAQTFACLLLDLHMPDVTGFDVLADLQSRSRPLPVIMITGHDQPGSAATARALGASDYLLKPLDESALLAALRRASPGLLPAA